MEWDATGKCPEGLVFWTLASARRAWCSGHWQVPGGPGALECGPLSSLRLCAVLCSGLPHYGHILAGTIKDIVTRYQSATGHHVTRRFGWDCHGLPVEYEIDQKLNIKTKDDVRPTPMCPEWAPCSCTAG